MILNHLSKLSSISRSRSSMMTMMPMMRRRQNLNNSASNASIITKDQKQQHKQHHRSSTDDGILRSGSDDVGKLLNGIEIRNLRNQLEIVVIKNDAAPAARRTLQFSPLWLRFNCHSPLSKQPDSGQRIIDAESVPLNLTIENVVKLNRNEGDGAANDDDNDDYLVIEWNKESGQANSLLPISFLLNNYPLPSATTTRGPPKFKSSSSSSHKKNSLLSFDYENFFDRGTGAKLNENIFEWIKCIAEHGICLLKNVPVEDKMVKNVAELIAPVQQTIYDETFDVKAERVPINIANTDAPLGFHMDLMYYESAPGLQFLHCLKFDDQIIGGESKFVDAFEMAEQFRERHPRLFANLVRIPATFQKVHLNRKRPVCMVYQRPHIVLNHHNQIMGVNWAPPFEGPLFNLSQEDINAYYESYIEFTKFINNHQDIISYRLRPGDVACFNNRRVLHAREGFISNNGERHLQGCYVNIDEFKSEALVQEFYMNMRTNMKRIKPSNHQQHHIEPRCLRLQSLVYGNHDFNSNFNSNSN